LLNSQPPKQLSFDVDFLATAFGSELVHDCSIILLSKLPVITLSEVTMLTSVSIRVRVFREGGNNVFRERGGKLDSSCLVLLV